MPIELEIAVGIVALLGFGISAFLAWLRFQEWRAKPDLLLHLDWIVGGGPSTLRIVAENRGDARGTVQHLVLSPTATHDPATAFVFFPHLDELPDMIDPRSFARFKIEVKAEDDTALATRLLTGGFSHVILIDQDGVKRAFPIPDQPKDGNNRVMSIGRVAKR